MRGSHLLAITDCVWAGIIPAHAGLTRERDATRSVAWDHPRACGAHTQDGVNQENASGSSPRMRGSPTSARSTPLWTGIIPAHAGLTVRLGAELHILRDHPRACGAHMGTSLFSLAAEGSSPRMRGSRLERNQCHLVAGIIPAHAGLTHGVQMIGVGVRDHPRACGAHSP